MVRILCAIVIAELPRQVREEMPQEVVRILCAIVIAELPRQVRQGLGSLNTRVENISDSYREGPCRQHRDDREHSHQLSQTLQRHVRLLRVFCFLFAC